MSFFAEAIKSLTDQSFTYSIGDPKNETEYLERVKIVLDEDTLTSDGLPAWDLVKNKQAELQADYNAKQYQRDRAVAYPSIQDQLDMQYHDQVNGTTTWKDAVAKVKSDNPKPE